MANKAKNYFVRFLVPDTEHEFAGNDRNATFAPSDSGNKFVTAYATNSVALNAPVLLPIEGEFKIKRVRLVGVGAECLKPGTGSPYLAGKIAIGCGIEDPENPPAVLLLDVINITVTRWGEWEETNKILRPFKNMSALDLSSYIAAQLFVSLNTTEFYCDDYDIGDAFVGQTVKPLLEMEVDAGAGLYDTMDKVLF